MKKLLLLILTSIFYSAAIADNKKIEWTFSYNMNIQNVNFKTQDQNRITHLKSTFSKMLSEKSNYCLAEGDLKKEIKKYFEGCDISYEEKRNSFEAEASCENDTYFLVLRHDYANEYNGTIKLNKNNDEFDLIAKGSISIKKNGICN